jgi:heptosyltransferase I
MPRPRVLFVKLSSLGDVVHHFPAVTDLAAHRPDVEISWAVEEAYAELVRLHPAVGEVIPVGLRALKSRPFSLGAWGRMRSSRRTLARARWDYVIDTQGLAKSAWVARRAEGVRFGLDRASAREGSAARSYDVRIPVARELHAVERNRRLVAEVFGYPLGAANYGLAAALPPPDVAPEGKYVVLLHAASREAKRWPAERWIGLGTLLAEEGFVPVLPGGSEAERAAAARIAASIPGAVALPATGLRDLAGLIANAWLVAGVDTGLTHLAVALGRPTVGIYCATRPELTGLYAGRSVNLGTAGAPPTVEDVAQAIGYGRA